MKKHISIFLVLFSYLLFAQNYTVEQVEQSNDMKVVAHFVKNNPSHPKTPEFKKKLFVMLNGEQQTMEKTPIIPINKNTTKSIGKDKKSIGEVGDGNKKTAELLTHLFDSNPNSKEAYMHIKNETKCDLVIKISGKKLYNLTVPANNDNYILLPKDTYQLTTSVCGAQYNSTKNLNKDMEIVLNATERTVLR